jgi:hypothetical protein
MNFLVGLVGSLVDEFWLDWLDTLMDEDFGDSSIPNRMECVLLRVSFIECASLLGDFWLALLSRPGPTNSP